jgi:hypothetical protein
MCIYDTLWVVCLKGGYPYLVAWNGMENHDEPLDLGLPNLDTTPFPLDWSEGISAGNHGFYHQI